MNIDFPENLPAADITEGILALGEAREVGGYVSPATTHPPPLNATAACLSASLSCQGFGPQDRLGRGPEEQFRNWANIVGTASTAIVGSVIFGAADRAAAAREVPDIRDRVVS
jgi:hypothetical protein